MAQAPKPLNQTIKIDHAQFWSFIFSGIRNIAAVLIACGVILLSGWQFIEPSVSNYIDAKFQEHAEALSIADEELKAETRAIREDINRLLEGVTVIEDRLPEPREWIEFDGAGQLMYPWQNYSALDDVPILYFLRRNNDCPAMVRVQFYSAELNGVVSRYTYDIPTVQATASFGFIPFRVPVTLPDNMTPGSWSYWPRMIPDRTVCPGERDVQLPPSPFFEVVDG